MTNILSNLHIFSLLTLIFTAHLSNIDRKTVRVIGLICSLISLVLATSLLLLFSVNEPNFQINYDINCNGLFSFNGLIDLNLSFGIDGMNIWLIILTTFLIPLCLLVGWKLVNFQTYCLIFLMIELILIIAFSSKDLFVFYLFFEAILVPMFFLVGIFGSESRNLRAAFRLFIITVLASLPMLVGIWLIYCQAGTTDISILETTEFSSTRQLVVFILWFVSFAVKTPLIPLHIWLPETHSNAPTGGSIILAGILLKLGTYGLIRWTIAILPSASIYFSPLIYSISILGMIYISLLTIRQIDIKKIVAYSSIAHMSICVLGIFSFNLLALKGSLLMMVGHGLISPGLFLCIHFLYVRFKTRILYYFGGIVQTMPLFSLVFLLLILANLSIPLISPTFVAEFLIISGIFLVNKWIAVLAAMTIVLTGSYSLFFYVKVCLGNLKLVFLKTFSDLNRFEIAQILPFVLLIIILGCQPQFFLNTIDSTIMHLLELKCITVED